MPYIDPDSPEPGIVEQLIKLYEESAARLKKIVLRPPGSTDSAMKFNQARALAQLHQVIQEIDRLKGDASRWTGKAVTAAKAKGLRVADEQLTEAGVKDHGGMQGSFSVVDRRSIEVIARSTWQDIQKSADSMKIVAQNVLRGMADNGLTVQQVNSVIAGGIIEGKPTETIRRLREDLRKVHGDQVVIPTRNGGTRTYDVADYARMVGISRTREVSNIARHERLADHGIDLVKIVGRISKNPCSLLLGHVFSISGRSEKYPAFSSVSKGQEPYRLFHPQCSKSTAPFIEGLSTKNSARASEAA